LAIAYHAPHEIDDRLIIGYSKKRLHSIGSNRSYLPISIGNTSHDPHRATRVDPCSLQCNLLFHQKILNRNQFPGGRVFEDSDLKFYARNRLSTRQNVETSRRTHRRQKRPRPVPPHPDCQVIHPSVKLSKLPAACF
jgi:hypothetical protein